VATRIWELLDGEQSLIQIRDMIVTEFEVNPEEASDDIIEFIQHLEGVGAINEV